MILFKNIKITAMLLVITVSLTLAGCNHNDSNNNVVVPIPAPTPITYSYEIKVINLTESQPMSPVALILHNEGQVWQVGQRASQALEMLAESGDNSAILADSMVLAGQSGAGVLLPGASETIAISITDTEPMLLSVVTMLVNTNDAFTGINAIALANLTLGESIAMTTSSYDAGTEKNSELMATIPGPAAGGEGFNAMRDDVDFVAMHSGIVSQDDGLNQSVLTQAHRFDNPTLWLSVTRTK